LSSTQSPTAATARRAVVVTFDRLRAGYLGCYGNDWIETPNFDRLATESVVFDQHFCDNLDAAAANHAWWTGLSQFALDDLRQQHSSSSIAALGSRGVRTCLVGESDGRGDAIVAPPFGEVLTATGQEGFDVPENDTPFPRTVNKCSEWLKESVGREEGALLWIKSRGVPVPWVPPRDFAELYLDEFGLADESDDGGESDDETGEIAARPVPEEGPSLAGPDRSLDWRYAAAMYAAYVTLLDRWLGRLLAILEATPGWENALLLVTAGTGQPLGEHGPIEDENLPLRSESIQTPLWVRVPGSDQAGTRRQCLVQATDLAPTLWEWMCETHPDDSSAEVRIRRMHGLSLLPWIRNEGIAPRPFVVLGKDRSEWGIRTPDFFYVEPGDQNQDADDRAARLFEKPHDRWDQSDVLSQYPEVVEELQGTLRRTIDELTRNG
jgi:arylsulfatase A-like enzyme